MATRITCSECRRDLKPHCRADNPCGWWTCTNRTCTARLFDISRNVMIRRDNTLVRLDPPT